MFLMLSKYDLNHNLINYATIALDENVHTTIYQAFGETKALLFTDDHILPSLDDHGESIILNEGMTLEQLRIHKMVFVVGAPDNDALQKLAQDWATHTKQSAYGILTVDSSDL